MDHENDHERCALEIAIEIAHPIYDCVYLALAQRLGRTLVTADRRFLRSLAGSDHAGRAMSLDDFAGNLPG